jgi:hypothetical protein
LTSSADQIEKLIKRFDEEVSKVKSECLKMAWYMRGGLSYDQAMTLSWDERNMVSALIKDNLETTKKSGLPFF